MKTNFFQKIIKRPRLIVQLLFLAVTNGYLYGFATGRIYTGPTKTLCVPGLNCYSCPGALGSCPIGSLQAVLASRNYRFSFYVVGFLMLFGSVFGRFICGWLCPFGLVQDLLYRIPIPAPFKKWISKRKNLPGHRILVWAKYLILVGFVVILPLIAVDIIGQGSPWFCKYICPLGAVYSLFNPIALYRYQVRKDSCIKCGKCQKACGMDIRVWETPNNPECIRCGDCVKACPTGALQRNCLRSVNHRKC